MKVHGFSFGFGPVLWSYKGSETEYTVRAIPMGGYVSFANPEDNPDGPNDPRLLQNRPVWDRIVVVSAGVVANIIFAYFVLVAQIASVGFADTIFTPGVVVSQVVPEMSAAGARAGLRAGDIITDVDGVAIEASPNSHMSVIDRVRGSRGEPLSLKVKRGDHVLSVSVLPELRDGERRLGLRLSPSADYVRRRAAGVDQVLSLAAKEFVYLFERTADGLVRIVSNFNKQAENLSGPIGVVAVGADIAKSDVAGLFAFAAVISLNLAIINTLPLPALDGGQLVFLVLEGVRGRPLSMRVQDTINSLAITLLIISSAVLIVRDTGRLEWVQKLLMAITQHTSP